jgi:organic radical activating enzyme
MDVKLQSSQEQEPGFDGAAFLARSLDFLRAARQTETFVKVICTGATEAAEIAEVARRIAEQSREVLLVLQPSTPRYWGEDGVGARRLLELQDLAAQYLADVRVIPQCHRMMGIR